MKTGKSLTELAQEIERQAQSKKDYIVNTRALTMTENAELTFQNGELKTLSPSSIAHGQLAAHTDIPKKYYDRLLSSDRELLARNVNKWLHEEPTPRMVRTLDGKARAFLSDKFSLGMENFDVAAAALPALIDHGAQIMSADITESKLYIKAVLPKIEGEVSKGDVVQAGIAISNSEVGMGALTIQPLVYRLICLNGAIFADSKFSARHVGARKGDMGDNFAHLLTAETLNAEEKALSLRIRDVINGSFSEAIFTQRLDLMRKAKGEKLDQNPVDVVEILSKRHGLNDLEKTGVLQRLIEGADLSRYGLHNAVTNMAQAVDSYDRATELETLGGNILTLAPTEWRVLAQAA